MTAAFTKHNAWRRLKKNPGALFGMIIILLSFLIAVFAYFIAPDNTPNANRMVVEIGGQHPGFTQQFLKIPKDQNRKISFLNQLVSGIPDSYQWVPIMNYQRKSDSLVIQKYIDEGLSERLSYPVSQLTSPSNSSNNQFTVQKKRFIFCYNT